MSAGSPCRGAGSAAYAAGTDIDGEPWLSPPSIGCDEYHPGALTGPLTVDLTENYTNVAVGYPVSFTALIAGRTSASAWDFGDSVVVSNQPYASHAWTAPGDYRVVLRAYNESQPGGVSATSSVHVVAGVMYVARTSTNPQPPYTSWATAATNIQQAVDAALSGILPGASLVLVSNGVYARPVHWMGAGTVRSANGPQLTIIDGAGTNQCVHLSRNAGLVGFTLTNGSCGVYGSGVASNCVITGMSGNGADGATLFNCALTRNSGIGAYSCTLHNCTLTANSGLGAVNGTLYNCTLTGNAGGGVSGGTLYNSIAYFNTASGAANYDYSSALNYCCTTPLPATGIGNITNAPLFTDDASGSLRPQSNSPCINAGNNGYLGSYDWNLDVWFTNQFDLDGNPRVVSGTVDIGAYEYQGAGSRISYAWLQQYGLATDGSADFIDFDVDGHNNWQEWRCGTVPTNTSSALRLLAALPTGTNVTVSWQSAAGINYLLERSPNLAVPFTLLATNILGQAGTTTYADTNTTGPGPFFYRVGVTWP